MFKKLYTISFQSNGGNKIDSISCKGKKDFPVLPTPKKEGYKFQGWFLDEKFSCDVNFEKMPKNDLVLYAKWEGISLDEFTNEINFFTKSANILQNLQNDYEDVPDFKDAKVDIKKKKTKKKSKKKNNKKVVKKKEDNNESNSNEVLDDVIDAIEEEIETDVDETIYEEEVSE